MLSAVTKKYQQIWQKQTIKNWNILIKDLSAVLISRTNCRPFSINIRMVEHPSCLATSRACSSIDWLGWDVTLLVWVTSVRSTGETRARRGVESELTNRESLMSAIQREESRLWRRLARARWRTRLPKEDSSLKFSSFCLTARTPVLCYHNNIPI